MVIRKTRFVEKPRADLISCRVTPSGWPLTNSSTASARSSAGVWWPESRMVARVRGDGLAGDMGETILEEMREGQETIGVMTWPWTSVSRKSRPE